VEGTGCWGAGLTRALLADCVEVVEVVRPDRRERRLRGKSNPIDAESAARAALNGTANGVPKTRDGRVKSIRALCCARSSAVKARRVALCQLRALVVSAPTGLRAQLEPLPTRQLLESCARFRPGPAEDPEQAAKIALRSLARRWQQLSEEIAELDRQLRPLVTAAGERLLERSGVGVQVAADLLVTAGGQPRAADQRRRVRPPHRHRPAARVLRADRPPPAQPRRRPTRQQGSLHHRADPHAGRPRTRAYVARRTAEGLSKRKIMRCLKRYVAREIHHALTAPAASAAGA